MRTLSVTTKKRIDLVDVTGLLTQELATSGMRDGALVAYDLGNLVFDDQSHGGNEGAILVCRMSKQGVQAHQLIATRVKDCRAVLEKPGAAAL